MGSKRGYGRTREVRRQQRFPFVICVVAVVALAAVALTTQSEAAVDAQSYYRTFAVSPDGTRIGYGVPTYDEYADPVTELWMAKLDGSGSRKIGAMPQAWDVSWYDDSHLACTQFDAATVPIISVQDGGRRDLRLSDKYYWIRPSVSPDGNWVAFNAVEKEPREVGIFLLDVQTGDIRRISSEVVKSYVSWSPDSKKIAYGVGGYQKDYKIQVLDIASGEAEDTGLEGVGVQWSPDGRRIAYSGNIVRGGFWHGGIPADSALVVTDLQTKASHAVSDAPTNSYDKDTKHWDFSGAISPKWSPDGTKIAYRRIHTIMDGSNTKLDEDQVWAAKVDGSDRKMVAEKWGPFEWTPDSASLLIRGDTGMTRVALDSGKQTEVVSWKVPEAPELTDADWKTEKTAGAEVEYARMKPDYVQAILKIAAEARRVYADELGADVPETVHVRIEKKPGARASLWTDGDTSMFLTIGSQAQLEPPTKSGVFNIYGICHELGHMVMYRSMGKQFGIPEGVAQGWAHYAGSVVVDKVYARYGPKLWPEPYDYAKVDGTGRLAEQAANSDAQEQPSTRAGVVFYQIDQKYGTQKVFDAMKAALADPPTGIDLMPRFVDALVKVSGDDSARAMVPESMVKPKVKWDVAEREITDATFEGLKKTDIDGGVLLSYDDGSSDGMRSTSGSGHAVVYKAPPGKWAVDYVQLYGSRYGEEKPPEEDFSIFFCDRDFNLIGEVDKPYSTFDRGDPRWYKIEFDPVNVPEVFYVVVYFQPTATKGVYVRFDESVAKSHSKSALPYTHVIDVQGKFDWMIRVHLTRSAS